MDEDAMMVAIGYMSMEEARDKYADEWAEFCKKLSNWKSIYQLLRLRKLHMEMLNLNEVAAMSTKAKNILEQDKRNLQASINQAMVSMGKKPSETELMKMYWSVDFFLKAHPNDQQAIMDLRKLNDVRDKLIANRNLIQKNEDIYMISKMKYMEAKDQYDITKPYAMGLLVADIFYSLSAAIEGDIY